MKYFKYILSLLLLCLGTGAYAQDAAASTDCKNNICERSVNWKVNQLRDYISFMSSKDKPMAVREDYMKDALNLFIGGGGPYEFMGKHRDGVVMQTTSPYRQRPVNRLMKRYFTGLINMAYSIVNINAVDINSVDVSQLKKIGDDTYECTAVYLHKFYDSGNDGIWQFTSPTRVEVRAIVKVDHTIDGDEYIVLLGDVYAIETRR